MLRFEGQFDMFLTVGEMVTGASLPFQGIRVGIHPMSLLCQVSNASSLE